MSFRMYRNFIGILLFFALLCPATCPIWAGEFRFDSAGVRFGFGAEDVDSQFNQAEAFADWELPWQGDLGRQVWLKTKLDASLGQLWDSHLGAGIFTVGPVLTLGYGKFPVSLEVGWSPTLISRDEFTSRDLGSLYQFSTHIGLNVDVLSRVRIGYRFLHMSNGGFAQPNPGLNMHFLGVSYLF